VTGLLPANYWAALGLTLAIEVPLVLWLLSKAPWRRVLIAALVGNLVTHLSIHLGLMRLGLGPTTFEIAAEGWALAGEAALYIWAIRPLSAGNGIAAAAIANGASYGLGLWLFG